MASDFSNIKGSASNHKPEDQAAIPVDPGNNHLPHLTSHSEINASHNDAAHPASDVANSPSNDANLRLSREANSKPGDNKTQQITSLQTSLKTTNNPEGFNGTLTSPTGDKHYEVKNGRTYDQNGNLIGHWDSSGVLKADGKQPDAALGLRLTGWKFDGQENGNQRSFTVSDKSYNGVAHVNGKEYKVVMNMLIDAQTNEQAYTFTPPTSTGNSVMNGGKLTKVNTNPPQETSLNDTSGLLKNASFNLNAISDNTVMKIACIDSPGQKPGEKTPGIIVDMAALQSQYQDEMKQANGTKDEINNRFTTGVLDALKFITKPIGINTNDEERAAATNEYNLASSKFSNIENMLTTGKLGADVLTHEVQHQTAASKASEQEKHPDNVLSPPAFTDDQPGKPGTVNSIYGRIRMNSESLVIDKGLVYNADHKIGDNSDHAIGRLHQGYVLELQGRPLINLAETSNLAIELHVGSPTADAIKILGLGSGGITSDGRKVSGGLVCLDEFKRQADQFVKEADAGNIEYCKNRVLLSPLFSMAGGDWASVIRRQAEDIRFQMKGLDSQFDAIFGAGDPAKNKSGVTAFDPQGFDVTRMQQTTNAVRIIMNNCGSSAADANTLANQATQFESQAEDSIKMAALAAMPVATGGIFGTLGTAGKLASLSQSAITAAQFATTTLGGGFVGAVLSQKQGGTLSDFGRNFVDSSIQSATMAVSLGGAFTQATRLAKELNLVKGTTQVEINTLLQSGKITSEQAALLTSRSGQLALKTIGSSSTFVAKNALELTDATKDTVTFNSAEKIRNGEINNVSDFFKSLSSSDIPSSAAFMYFGHKVGEVFSPEKIAAASNALRGRDLTNPNKLIQFLHSTPSSISNMGLYSALDAYKQGQTQGLHGSALTDYVAKSAIMSMQSGLFMHAAGSSMSGLSEAKHIDSIKDNLSTASSYTSAMMGYGSDLLSWHAEKFNKSLANLADSLPLAPQLVPVEGVFNQTFDKPKPVFQSPEKDASSYVMHMDGMDKDATTTEERNRSALKSIGIIYDAATQTARGAAYDRLAGYLSDGYIDDAKQVLELKILTDDDLKTEQIHKAACDGLARCLSSGDIDDAKKVLELKILTDDDLKTEQIHKAACDGLARCLSSGYIDDAKQVLELKILTDDDLKTEQIHKAAYDRLARCLSSGYIDGAKKVLELKILTDDDLKTEQIHKAAFDGLAYLLSSGYIDDAKQVLELKILTDDDLKTEQIHKAAFDGLAYLLSSGYIDRAKKVLELKILTDDEIHKAACDGLARCLSSGDIDRAKKVLELKILDQSAVDDCFRESVRNGHITSVVRTALSNGLDLNTALARYLGISKLNDETAAKFYEDLKKKDSVWKDVDNIQRPFEEGATVFGAARMLRYAFKSNATPHDALFAFHDVIELFNKSGLKKEQFWSQILSQVNKDDAIDDTGSSFSRLNAIAGNFPVDIQFVLDKVRKYPDIKALQELAASFSNQESVFKSWKDLQRFAKLQQLMNRSEFMEQIQQLRQGGQAKLADWVETLAFHQASNVSAQAITDFWQNPESFLDRDDAHSSQSHELKKPSNYTDIPHLDLNAHQLRDALVEGALDRVQVFSPMKVEYEVGGNNLDLKGELSRALGSRKENRTGEAKNPGKLFSEVNKLLKPNNSNVAQVLSGAQLSPELQQQVEVVLYNEEFGAKRPQTGLRLIAEIHKKSDPLAVVAGDDTASCMGFGTGKNNVYMFNPNDALFTVRLVRSDGTSRTIAQSVLTKDRDVKVPVPTIIEKMQANERASLHTIFPEEALRSEKAIIAADNVEVHPNYKSGDYPSALEAVYRDFFARYIEMHGANENLQADKLIIGLGYSDAMGQLPKEKNTYVPQAPLGYSDKTHDQVLSLSLTEPQKIPLQVLGVENNQVENRVKPQPTSVTGITPLTFEDTLPIAYLEGKVFQDSPSLQAGLHNMENALIAKDINNAAKERPNLSLKYTDPDGKMKAYILAYEGKEKVDGAEHPVIFISDFSSDRQIGSTGRPNFSVSAGKLLQKFVETYKEHYLDQGNLTPIFTNARDNTSYNLLMRQIGSLGQKTGYRFEVQEIDSHQADSSTMHDVLIVPHKISQNLN